MTTKATVATLSQHAGESVALHGWIYKLRGKGKIAFLHIRDGSGIVSGEPAHPPPLRPTVSNVKF